MYDDTTRCDAAVSTMETMEIARLMSFVKPRKCTKRIRTVITLFKEHSFFCIRFKTKAKRRGNKTRRLVI